MKTYRGIREPLCHVRVIDSPGAAAPFAPAPPFANGSRLGGEHELAVPRELVSQPLVPFDWSADGPGTHYLAVALLADLLGAADRAGIKAALPFMRRFLSKLPREDFEICDTVLRAFLYAAGTAAAPPRALPNGSPNGSSNGAAPSGHGDGSPT